MRIISRVVSSRKELDEVHTLRSYSRPISFQQNLNQIERFYTFNKYQQALALQGADAVKPLKSFSFFKHQTKRPCKVVLKAPFHYKKGKHRLTLFQRNLTLMYHCENKFCGSVSPLAKVVRIVDELTVNAIPITSGTVPGKSTLLEVTIPLSIHELLFSTTP